MGIRPEIVVAILAHNEERRIGTCLASLPLDDPAISVHVVVNGSTDRTAEIARSCAKDRATIHEWTQGGKARSWNRFVLDDPAPDARCFVFVDGDAEIAPGSIKALAELLRRNPHANGASGLPRNGRRADAYRQGLTAEHGMFGDLYALSGEFVGRLRSSGIRLPDDLIGDDSLIGALAKTDLRDESHWREDRLLPCPQAGFLCEPTRLSAGSLHGQYRRMINYSVRHFQNRMVSEVMRGPGPQALPSRMADLYPAKFATIRPRPHPAWWWFDRQALARMRAAAATSPRLPRTTAATEA